MKFSNATINIHFGFVFDEETSGSEITCSHDTDFCDAVVFKKKKKNLIFKPFSVHTQIQPVLLERVFLTSSVVVTED